MLLNMYSIQFTNKTNSDLKFMLKLHEVEIRYCKFTLADYVKNFA